MTYHRRNLAIGIVTLAGMCAMVTTWIVAQQRLASPPATAVSHPAPDGRTAYDRLGNPRAVTATIDKLAPLHTKLGEPGARDWLANHDEPGQTFAEYLRIKPATPTGRRHVIYVQPLGEFTDEQRRIVELSAEYLGLYFDRPVKIAEDVSLEVIPAKARREHPRWEVKQILSTYVLDQVLKPRLPDDAAAYIAFTASDLWPGEGWNFVFGQASLRDRVGVWSIHRNGNPSEGDEAFRTCLRRTLKTATHETGHMFSMRHCTAYECNMCGSNHREESDRHPLYLCPQCHAKLAWATAAEPVERFKRLGAFCEKHGLEDERAYYAKAAEALGP